MKKLLTTDDAVATKKQHKSPCSDCPWARKSIKGWLGNMSAEEWLALAHGEGIADCHGTKQSDGSAWECAGLAIYRANVCKSVRDPAVMRLPPDRVKVFSWGTEFLAHHEPGSAGRGGRQ
jgi:hypothetical protein